MYGTTDRKNAADRQSNFSRVERPVGNILIKKLKMKNDRE